MGVNKLATFPGDGSLLPLMKLFFQAILATLAVPALAAAEPAIIAKARAYLGPESALDAVHSLRLTGEMTVDLQGGKPEKRTARFDIIFQKPWEENLTTVSSDTLQQTVLDEWDGWARSQKRAEGDATVFDDRKEPALTILGPTEIQSLRADVWENLNYYRGLDEAGGETRDEGEAVMDGVRCEKVAFVHSGGVTYTRYFDADTGRLVFTESLRGSKIRESGEQFAAGIRFPKTIVEEQVDSEGRKETTTMTIEHVVLNRDYPRSMFATPLPPLAPGEVKSGELGSGSAASIEAPSAAATAVPPQP
jgi:hypothetical protein